MQKFVQTKRVFLAAGIVIAAMFLAGKYIFLAHLPGSVRQEQPVQLTAAPIDRVNKVIRLPRGGSIQSAAAVPVNADFSGQVTALYVKEGQAVKAGQPLYQLKAAPDAIPNQPAMERSQELQDNYDNALRDYQRYQKLHEIGGIPRRQLETAAARVQEAKDALANAPVASTISSLPENGLSTVTAPVDGVVTQLSVTAGAAVQAGQQLCTLGSGQAFEAVVQLSQNDLYLVHLGTPALVQTALHQTVSGQISRIYPQVEAEQDPYFLAHVKLGPYPPALFQAGMAVTVYIDTAATSPVAIPAVPTTSIFQDSQGQSCIYLAVDGKAVVQPVSLGETMGELTEITSALPEQSLLVTNNPRDTQPGASVNLAQ